MDESWNGILHGIWSHPMTIHPVSRLDLPELEPYTTLRENTRHWRSGFFVAEGEKVVLRLLESTLPILSMLLTPEWLAALEPQLQHERYHETVVYLAPPDLIDTIVGVRMHKRLMAIAPLPPHADPWNAPQGPPPRLHVVVEGIADAENMGTIIRNCAAFGASTLVVGPDSSPPFLRRSVRVSMGTIFSLPVHECDDVVRFLLHARSQPGWKVVATTPRGGDTSIPMDGVSDLCLVCGSEGEGLTEEAMQACPERFSIPMHLGVDSLNVATALAVSLYEIRRHL